jgi:hypothetical protein
MNATSPDLIQVDWIELELSDIIDRYGWESTLNGLKSLLPLGETLSSMIESIEDQQTEALMEESEYIAMSDRDGYRSDCF